MKLRSHHVVPLFLTLTLGMSQAKQVNLTYLTHWPPDTVNRLNDAIKRYQAKNPDVHIQVRAVPFANLLSTLRTQASNPSGPTIAGIYDLWLPELVRDKVADAAPAANASDVRTNWPAGITQNASVGGKVYGYPNEVDAYALIYNKALFKEAGVTAAPKTWAELETAAKKLTKADGNGNITQQGFGMINSWTAGVVHPFLALMYSNGGNLLANNRPLLNSKAAQETAALYDRLLRVEKVTSASMGTADANTTGPYLQNFINGKTGMLIMANWWESALKEGMGDNFKNVATAPIPVGPSGTKAQTLTYTWSNVVNAKASAEQRAAAWNFLKWLNSAGSGSVNGSSAMADILMSMGILPSRSSDLKAYNSKLNTPFLSGFVSQIPTAKPFPIVLGGEEMSNSLKSNIEALQFGRQTPAATLTNAQTEITKILGRYYK